MNRKDYIKGLPPIILLLILLLPITATAARGIAYESTIASSKFFFGSKIEACMEVMRIGEDTVAEQCEERSGIVSEDNFNYGNCTCKKDTPINNGYKCTVGVNVKCLTTIAAKKKTCKGTQLPRAFPGYARFRCLDCSIVDLKTGLTRSGQLTLNGSTKFQATVHDACNKSIQKRKERELKNDFGIEIDK